MKKVELCAYCGVAAGGTRDHLVPYLYAGRMPQRWRRGVTDLEASRDRGHLGTSGPSRPKRGNRGRTPRRSGDRVHRPGGRIRLPAHPLARSVGLLALGPMRSEVVGEGRVSTTARVVAGHHYWLGITPASVRASPVSKRIIEDGTPRNPDPISRRWRPAVETPPTVLTGFASSEQSPHGRSAGRGRLTSGCQSPALVRPNRRHPTPARCLTTAPGGLAACSIPARQRTRSSVSWLREPRPGPAQQFAFLVSCAAAAVSRGGSITV
jgi:hypothetical protein